MLNMMDKLSDYVCDRYYVVTYGNKEFEKHVKGILVNYNNGNIVLLSEDGIRHIKYNEITFMSPTPMKKIEKYNEKYQDFLRATKDCETMVAE